MSSSPAIRAHQTAFVTVLRHVRTVLQIAVNVWGKFVRQTEIVRAVFVSTGFVGMRTHTVGILIVMLMKVARRTKRLVKIVSVMFRIAKTVVEKVLLPTARPIRAALHPIFAMAAVLVWHRCVETLGKKRMRTVTMEICKMGTVVAALAESKLARRRAGTFAWKVRRVTGHFLAHWTRVVAATFLALRLWVIGSMPITVWAAIAPAVTMLH